MDRWSVIEIPKLISKEILKEKEVESIVFFDEPFLWKDGEDEVVITRIRGELNHEIEDFNIIFECIDNNKNNETAQNRINEKLQRWMNSALKESLLKLESEHDKEKAL